MNILILGAGFAGIAAANTLAKKLKNIECNITIFDKNTCSAIIPVLPDFCGEVINHSMICQEIPKIIDKKVKFINEEILSINLNYKKVTTPNNDYYYDYLIIASGSKANFFNFNQNKDKLYPLVDINQGIKLHDDFIKYLNEKTHPKLIVAGAGYTGVEAASHLKNIANKLNKNLEVFMIEKSNIIFPFFETEQREYVEKYIASKNFKLFINTSITEFDGKKIILSTGETISDIFVCWTTGTKQSISNIKGDIETVPDGRIKVNKFLQIPNYKEVTAAGDAAAIINKETILRKAVNFSIYSGKHAAINTANQINSKPLKIFNPIDLGWLLPLGDTAIGNIFNKISIKGKFGMRLHYIMSGIRCYNWKNKFKYFILALKLK